MSNTANIPLRCPCEKEHVFEETFRVEGAGSSSVQVRCPHLKCPTKDKLLTFDIPWELTKDEPVYRGGGIKDSNIKS